MPIVLCRKCNIAHGTDTVCGVTSEIVVVEIVVSFEEGKSYRHEDKFEYKNENEEKAEFW